MATPFRLDLAFPKTNIKNAFSKSFTAADQVVQSIEVSLKKEQGKGRISSLTATLHDPNWDIFHDLPDPAFFDIPVKLYMGPPGNPSSLTTLVYEGIAIRYRAVQGGGLSTLQVVSQDNSHKARTRALSRTYTNKTSVQLAKAIADAYGWTVDVSTGSVDLIQRTISIGVPGGGETHFTDWDHLVRELESDGLTCHMQGKKLVIRQHPTERYAHSFKRGDGLVKVMTVEINHVRGAGGMGNNSTPVAFDNTGTDKAMQGQAEASKVQGGDGRTHRRPVGGAKSNSDAHSQDTKGTNWENAVIKLRGRKDTATLECNPVPDVFLHHVVNLDGVGSKADGLWEVTEISHVVVPSDAGSSTTLQLTRGTNGQAAKQAGTIAFAYEGVS